MQSQATQIFSTDEMLPAVGQGAIAITVRADDAVLRDALALLSHPETEAALTLERAFLAVLDGSCRTPIAGHAQVENGTIGFRGLVLRPDGTDCVEIASEGAVIEAAEIGLEAGHDIKARLPSGMLQG